MTGLSNAKSALTGVMALLTAGLVLAGCGNSASSAESTEAVSTDAVQLEYWTPFSGGDNLFMTEMVDQFNQEHKEIQVVQMNSRLDDYYSRLRTAILSGNAPDVAIIHASSLPRFVQNGYIEDLYEPAQEAGLDFGIFNQTIMKASQFQGRPYAVPLDTHTLVLYYNKTYLSQAGLLDPQGKPILEQGETGFTSFLQQLKRTVPADVAPLAQPSTRIDSVWLWWSLYNQIEGGGAFYDASGTKAVMDNPAALKALTYINGLYASGLIPANITDAFKMFHDGKAAALITGVWATGALEQAEQLDFGVVPLPTLYDKPAAWADSHTLTIPAQHEMTPEKRQAAMIFMKWLAEHGAMWAEAGHVPSVSAVLNAEAFKALNYRSDYAAAANSVVFWPKATKQFSMVEVLIRQFERMIYREQTPEQTLHAAVQEIDAELTK
ncbi:multiple sugar transport system substrate-binding protein [Paenibacillus phyllosphaerae]|uniref:Multiple sugar transport system substrate-binding protein n=1 Tax=Paenibacillus phyllosphaerae TaxID=274593 RepID=A0A7W5AZW7_9BACL|nr:ABC transporter substrate-binding protein [Paenibacillus phyllosphaerae]MBB3111845.1 multiple sugar transport system substrate-binding protein [Paenibacillus phyllosphaerae]